MAGNSLPQGMTGTSGRLVSLPRAALSSRTGELCLCSACILLSLSQFALLSSTSVEVKAHFWKPFLNYYLPPCSFLEVPIPVSLHASRILRGSGEIRPLVLPLMYHVNPPETVPSGGEEPYLLFLSCHIPAKTIH